VTEDIDQAELITKVLDEEAQQKHLEDNETTLQEQATVFYDKIIVSVAPEAEITYEFTSRSRDRVRQRRLSRGGRMGAL